MRTAVRFPARVSLEQILDGLARDPEFSQMVTRWERIPPRRASYAEYPAWLDGRISATLRRRAILSLYSHQADALESTHAGKHTVIVTPTASGNTLCYDLPVIDALAKDPTARTCCAACDGCAPSTDRIRRSSAPRRRSPTPRSSRAATSRTTSWSSIAMARPEARRCSPS